jgi:DNA-directed RNA polymerase beta subunit
MPPKAVKKAPAKAKSASKPEKQMGKKLNCDELRKEDLIVVADAEVSEHGLIDPHMSSFDDFTGSGMPQIVTQLFEVKGSLVSERNKSEEDLKIKTIEYNVTFDKIDISKPIRRMRHSGKSSPLYPYTARRWDLNYSATMFVDATITATAYLKDGSEPIVREPVKVKGHRIGQIPIMVGSKNCNLNGLSREAKKKRYEDPNDPGGYFILKGGEWVISIIESRVFNYPHIFRNVGHEKEIARLEFISKPGDYFENSSELIMRYLNTGNLYLTFTSDPYLKGVNIPFYVLFRLFGMNIDKEIFDNIVYGYSTGKEPNVISDRMVKILRKAISAPDPYFNDFQNLTDQGEILIKFAEVAAENYKPSYRAKDVESTKQYLIENVLRFFDERVMPHIGMSSSTRHDKLRFLGHLIHRMLLVEMEVAPPTDRDSLRNKRLDPAGKAYAKTFKRDFNLTVVQDVKKKFRNDFKSTPFSQLHLDQTFRNAIDGSKLERQLNSAIVVGNKEITVSNRQVPNRLASEMLNRKNQLNYLSTLRVIRTPSTSSSKQDQRADEMRRVHPSYIGYICLIQSADTGEQVGMVKQLALNASISKSSSSESLKITIRNDPDIDILASVWPDMIYHEKLTKVMVNGYWIGCCRDAKKVVTKYREYRRGYTFAVETVDGSRTENLNKSAHNTEEDKLKVNEFITVYWDTDTNEINFWIDSGRAMRPLLIVRNNTDHDPVGQKHFGSKYNPTTDNGFMQDTLVSRENINEILHGDYTSKELRKRGIIEYISPEEAENCFIASSIDELKENSRNSLARYTHCEVPQALLGIPALTCPYAESNQAPRITFQTNQVKQTCAYFALNWAHRIDKHAILQYYCEAPVISTIANKYIYPMGCNAIVAIACYGGYNQEDSLSYCTTAAERGFYKVQAFSNVKTTLDNDESFALPDERQTSGIKKHANYEHLDNDGMPKVGSLIRKNDVLIGKVTSISSGTGSAEAPSTRGRSTDLYNDSSVIYQEDEDVYVEEFVRARNQDGDDICKVKLSAVRQLGIGDKFSSRHGQKGVTGIGYSTAKMPFTSDGLVVDIILNPHAIPSRMTIGQLLEGLDSKINVYKGVTGDATIFRNNDDTAVCEELERLGYDMYGNDRMFNGNTGEWIDVKLFNTPIFYQRLQKFVTEEVYSVSTGPTSIITRQPLEGKMKKGGLRIGEMEKDVIISHGAGHFIMEKFRDDSDGFEIYVCRTCGQMPVVNEAENIIICLRCQSAKMVPKILKVRSTWTSKLFLQELQGMSVGHNLGISPYEYEEHL